MSVNRNTTNVDLLEPLPIAVSPPGLRYCLQPRTTDSVLPTSDEGTPTVNARVGENNRRKGQVIIYKVLKLSDNQLVTVCTVLELSLIEGA